MFTLEELNQFLPKDKLQLSEEDFDEDAVLASTIAKIVLARLSTVFDTALWIDADTTPELVRHIIAMQTAGSIYHRQFGDDAEGQNWGRRLISWSESLLSGLVDGTLAIDAVMVPLVGTPYTYPTEPVFTMGQIF